MMQTRSLQQKQFKEELQRAKQSPMFLKCMKYLGLTDCDIIIATNTNKSAILKCASHAYSANPMCQIFRLKPDEIMNKFDNKIDRLIETQTFIILINKTSRKIIGGVGYLDLCEIFEHKNKNNLNKNQRFAHLLEVHRKTKELYLSKHSTKYSDLTQIMKLRMNIKNNKNQINIFKKYYGKWCELTMYFVKPKFRGNAYGTFIDQILKGIVAKMGYGRIFTANNPRSIKNDRGIVQIKFSDIIFDDGTPMIKYINELKTKYNYEEKKVIEFKKLSNHFVVVSEDVLKDTPWNEILKNILMMRKSKL